MAEGVVFQTGFTGELDEITLRLCDVPTKHLARSDGLCGHIVVGLV